MATRETAVERYKFRCHHCDREWAHDYDVVHVTLPGGDTRDYYSRGGLPVAAPGAPRSVSCPACGAEHADVSFVAQPAPEAGKPPPEGAPAKTDPAESARKVVQAMETLLATAKEPGDVGFSRVDDVKEVVRALQSGVAHLPQLLHELGNVLDHVESRPSPRHAGDIPDAIRSLHRAADTAQGLTGPVADELSHVRTALATLESFTVRASHESQAKSA